MRIRFFAFTLFFIFGFLQLRPASAAVDLSSELATIDSFLSDTYRYHLDCTAALKKSTLLSTDVDPLRIRSGALRSHVLSVQSAIASIVRKLKAANQYENFLADTSTKTSLDSLLVGTDFNQLLTSASSGLDSTELAVPIDNLSRKLSGSTSFTTFKFNLSCTVGRIQLKVIKFVGGTQTKETCVKINCACNGNALICGTAAEAAAPCPADNGSIFR